MRIRSFSTALVAALTTVAVASCGGSSDVVGGDDSGSSAAGGTSLSLVAYSVPKIGFDKVIPAFEATTAGKGVTFAQSYGPSGDQSRKVEAGAPADVVNFSLEPDVQRLVDKGIVDKNWADDGHNGIAFGSVVTIVTRPGNPKGIKDWDDLLQPGLEVVTPNPFSSGSAKWNLLAPYAEKSDGGKDPAAGAAYISKLVKDHVKVQPASGREATETFLQGTGDVLLTYENEGLNLKTTNPGKTDFVTPPQTFKIENPVAVLNNSKHPEQAQAFKDYLYTPDAQKLWAEAGFRPVDETVAKQYASKFPTPAKLWTIDDLGGWSKVNDALFDEDNGSIAKIYNDATK